VIDTDNGAEQADEGRGGEPTEARTGKPACMRLMTESAVRCSDSVIHSLVPMAPDRRVLFTS
jgi:hypothetical protein